MSLLHRPKFKLYLRDLSLHSHNMTCIKLGHLLIVWLELGCLCACVSWRTNLGCVSMFPQASWVHAKWGDQNSPTIGVYAATYNMTPSVSSVSSYQMLGAVLLCFQLPDVGCSPILCLQLPDVGCSPTVLTNTIYMNFSTHFIFICESWLDFFQINGWIKLEQLIYKFTWLEFHKLKSQNTFVFVHLNR